MIESDSEQHFSIDMTNIFITMKKILVPTDFSLNASSAFKYAYSFAGKRDMVIDLLHVVVPQTETSDFPMLSGHLTTNKVNIAKEVMKTWVETSIAQIDHSNISYKPKVNTFTKVDYPVHGINHFASEDSYELVICGTRGENVGTLAKLFGTVSGGLSQKLSIPALFIPLNFEYEQINYIGYASNLNPSDPYELWKALELILPDVPITRFYHVSEDSSEIIEKRKNEMEKYLYSHNDSLQIIFYDVASGDIDKSLMDMINNFNLEMLVMTKRKKSLSEKWTSKSVTKSMLRKANVPLLILSEE